MNQIAILWTRGPPYGILRSVRALNPNYTFENLVWGTSNEAAYEAVKAFGIADELLSPLFIHGPRSSGKTHILHACTHRAMAAPPESTIRYITSEDFLNKVREAERQDNLNSFRRGVGKIDVLLIDDLEFLQDKRWVHGELLHTLDNFGRARKTVAITSSVSLEDLKFSDPLKKLLAGGNVIEIDPPDPMVRLTVLFRHATQLGFELPLEVAEELVEAEITVGQMLGSLTTLMARCQAKGEHPTNSLVQEIIGRQSLRWSLDRILYVVSHHFHQAPDKLKGRGNSQQVACPRQIVCYLSSEAGISLSEIGRHLNRHHTTVLHSINKVAENRRHDEALNQLLSVLAEEIDGA